jgi:Rad3-related DNA helicase
MKYICKYKTLLKDYKVGNKGTKKEQVFLSPDTQNHYQDKYFQWSHLENLKENIKRDWRPYEYFEQLSIAIVASHSVLNYSIFLALIHKNLPSRELLVLDEAHLLEMELVRFRGISISKKKWRKYIPYIRRGDSDCKYRTFPEDYTIIKGTIEENDKNPLMGAPVRITHQRAGHLCRDVYL